MVHVMSEVKPVHRYKAQTMFSFGGSKIEYFPHGPDVVLATEFDAQGLRADTAEALSVTNLLIDIVPGLDGMGYEVYAKSVAEVSLLISNLYLDAETAGEKLAAAEQRIDRLAVLLRRADDFIYIMTGSDPERHLNKNWEAAIEVLRGEIAAALNPKPEAGSHE
jgi:hypothetical protein